MAKIKLSDLNLDEHKKKVLAKLIKPMNISQVAVELGLSYTSTYQILSIWEASGYVKKLFTLKKRNIYALNQDNIKL